MSTRLARAAPPPSADILPETTIVRGYARSETKVPRGRRSCNVRNRTPVE